MTSFTAYLHACWQTLSITVSRLTARKRWVLPALVGTVCLWSAIAHPAKAYQVQVLPTSPAQGDTLSVVVEGNSSAMPTVTVEDTTYTAFPLSDNRYRALVPTSPNTTPGRMALRVEGSEGTNNIAVSIGNRSFNTQYINLSPGRAGLEGTDYEFDSLDALRALRTPTRYWDGPMARPSNGYVSSAYGNQRYYNGIFAEGYYHRGVDYAAGNGSPIYAPAAGRIALVGRESDGFVLNGNTLGIDHGQGVTSVMIHLSGFAVNEGDMVQQGQLIGYMGATGFATGPNLHWGLFVNGISVDPVPWRHEGID
ncbi:M23 family metallopeptidase [Synechococcus sp. PCC 7335]|uniref:M23 family metallopeptidase n=1 Tax=Synechococcus sp. (strain ATCC 29403 / PCC 7335) TaxID=91464 RepID=UPI0008FEB6F8|nr:M23 family metallopeptidase [Synechococcus sp. PCC 7335]